MAKKKDKEEIEAAAEAEDKKKQREAKLRQIFIEDLRKKAGKEVHFANEHVSITDVISTGHPELDKILTPGLYEERGEGGIPTGFLCEFYGPNAGGKSSLCLKLGAQVHKKKGQVLWVDAEGSFVTDWAENHGLELDKTVILSAGLTGEEYLTKLESLIMTGQFRLAVVDSLTGLVPQNILNADLEDNARVGEMARMMSRAAPKIVHAAKHGNCAVVFINQIRNKIGVMYGDPETTPGGEALKFYASLRLRVSQVSGKNNRGIMKDGEEIGIRSNVMVKKNRFGPPYREMIMPIYYDTKTKPHPLDMIIDMAMSTKVIRTRTKKVGKGDESIQTFSYEAPEGTMDFTELKNLEGLDEFKNALDGVHIRELVKALEVKKVAIDPEIKEYLATLDIDGPANAEKIDI